MLLTAQEVRVLGCLVEKQWTTPDQYPLTRHALVMACNQTTNRDPVLSYDEALVAETLFGLQDRGLTRTVHLPGARVPKHRHVLDEAWGLGRSELAVLALLMLRGPQTAAELRARADRLHTFGGNDEVEQALAGMAGRDEPLVLRLDRRPGQKEARWAHWLTGEVADDGVAARAIAADAAVRQAVPGAGSGLPQAVPGAGAGLPPGVPGAGSSERSGALPPHGGVGVAAGVAPAHAVVTPGVPGTGASGSSGAPGAVPLDATALASAVDRLGDQVARLLEEVARLRAGVDGLRTGMG